MAVSDYFKSKDGNFYKTGIQRLFQGWEKDGKKKRSINNI